MLVQKLILTIVATAFGPLAFAGSPGSYGSQIPVTSVPVDSPVALLALATGIAIVVARVLRNRNK